MHRLTRIADVGCRAPALERAAETIATLIADQLPIKYWIAQIFVIHAAVGRMEPVYLSP